MVHEEDQRPLSAATPPPSSFPLETQDSQNFVPPLELMDSAQKNVDEIEPGLENSSASLPLNSITAFQESPFRSPIVSHIGPLKTNRRPWSRKAMSPATSHWNKKKLETLSQHFNPIPFPPKERPLDIASHQILLTRLGLWDFLNLDFDTEIRADLLKELVVWYKPKGYNCRSHVHGMGIALGRSALAHTLRLRAKRSSLQAKGSIVEDGDLVVSQEEASFLQELIWGWLVLKDDDSEVVDDYLLEFSRSIRELRFENTDWAGLIWFMVKRELSKGKILVNCYYASHLQLLLKHQRPELFDDHVDQVGSPDLGTTDAGGVKMFGLEKESGISIDKGTVGVEGRENVQEKENIMVKCLKRKREFFEKFVKEKTLCTEEIVKPDGDEAEKLRKQQSGACLSGGIYGGKQQMQDQNQDQHQRCSPYEGEDEKQRCLTDLECSEMDHQAVDWALRADATGKVPESNTPMDSLMNQESHEEGLKIEGSTNLMIGVMDDLQREEMKYQSSSLISNEEGERNLSSGEKVEHVVTGKINVSYDKFDQNEDEVMEALGNEEACGSDVVDSLDNEEKLPNAQVVLNAKSHVSDFDISLKEVDYREMQTYNFSKSSEEYVEPKVSHVDDFQNCASGGSMQVTLNAFPGSFGSGNVEERKNEEEMDLNLRGLRLVHCKKEDDVMIDEANEAESEAIIGSSHEVHSEKDVIEDKATGAECEANMGSSIDAHCEKKDDVMEDKVSKAAFETNVGNSLEVHCEEEDDVMKDKANEAAGEANIRSSLEEELQNVQLFKDRHQLELEVRHASKKKDSLADLASDKMHYQEDVLNCMMDNTGKEVATIAYVYSLVTQEAHEEELNREGSTVLVFGGMDGLDAQEIDNQPVQLVSGQENDGKKSILESPGEEGELGVHEKVNISDELFAKEMDDVGSELKLMQHDKDDVTKTLVNEEACEGKVGDVLDNKEKDLHKIDVVSEKHNAECTNALTGGMKQEDPCLYEYSKSGEGNVELEASSLHEFLAAGMDCLQITSNSMECKNESVRVRETKAVDALVWKYEKKDQGKCQMSEGFVLQHCTTSNVDDSQVLKEASPAQYTECDDPQKKCRLTQSLYSADGMELTGIKEVIFDLPNYSIDHSLGVPLVSNSNAPVEKMIPSVHGNALQYDNINGTEVAVEHFASETEMNMNLAGCSCENPMKREIDNLDGGHYGHGTETKTTIHSHDENGQGGFMDLAFCSERVEVWMARLKNAALKKVEANDELHGMLLRKIEEQSQIIQRYEMLRRKEQQQKQKDVRKYERELRLMQSVLQDYRKALKEVQNSFAKYRERCQLPDESLYMDHPSGGGRVIPVAEWKKMEEERQKKSRSLIKAMMEDFEEEWISTLEAHLGNFDSFCDRLEDLEYAVSMVKAKVWKSIA